MDVYDKYFREDAIGVVLNQISRAIPHIDESTYDSDPGISVWQERFDVVVTESLLGVLFVLCQTYVTAVISDAITRDEQCFKQYGRRLPSAKGGQKDRKGDIRAIGGPKIQGTPYNVAEVVNAFANYFKHRDEWNPSDWTHPKELNKKTVEIITTIGASPQSERNLYAGACALATPEQYREFAVLEKALKDWGQNLEQALKNEMHVVMLGYSF